MADNRETILVDIQLDAGKVAKDLQDVSARAKALRNQANALRQEIKNGNDENGAMSQRLAEVNDELSWTNKQMKGLSATTKLMTADANTYSDSLNGERQKLADLQKMYDQLDKTMRNSDGGKALLEQIKEQDAVVKGLEEDTGRFQRNVGNYQSALTKAIPGFDKFNAALEAVGVKFEDLGASVGEAVKGIGNGLKNLGKQAMSMLANPVILAISAVLVVLKQLYDAFQRNERAQLAWEKAIAPFKAAWQGIQRVFDDVIKAFQRMGDAFGADGKTLETLMRVVLLPLNATMAKIRTQILLVSTAVEAMGRAFTAGVGKLKEFAANTNIAGKFNKLRGAISGFKDNVIAMKDAIVNSDIGKRMGLDKIESGIRDIAGANSELIEQNKAIAQGEADIAKMTRNNLKADADAQRYIAELHAKVEEKDKYTSSQRLKFLQEANNKEEAIARRAYELAKKKYDVEVAKNSLTESNAEDLERENQAYSDMIAAQTAYLNKKKELNTKMSELREQEIAERRKQEDQQIALIQDETERALAVRRAAGNREVEDLQRKLDKLKETDVEGRKAISDLMLKIEENTQKELTRIQLDSQQKRLQQLQQNALARLEIDTRGDALLVGEKRLQIAEENYNRLQNLTKEQVAAMYKTEEDYATALLAAEQEQFNAREAVATEEYSRKMQRIQNEYDERLIGIDNEAVLAELELEQHQEEYDALVEMDAETKARLYANEEEYDAAVISAQKKLTASMDSMVKSKMKCVEELASAFTQMSDALSAYSEQSEAAAKAQKAFALAGILMNQAVSISEGVLAVSKGIESAAAVPFPGNIPAIISVVAQITSMLASAITGIQQAKQVFQQGSAAADAGNFSQGGTVPGTSYTGDKVIAHVNSGEAVLTPQQQKNFMNLANTPSIGFDMNAFADILVAAVAAQPAPVMDYSEFTNFQQKVSTYNEIARI